MTSKKHLTVKHLNAANLQDVLLLQENIIKGLHPDEKHFILQRTAQDYKKALSGHSSNILGVFDKDKLIAQAVFILPKNNEKRDMAEFKPDIANEDLVLYEAILVDPEYRGSNLMKRMLDYIEAHASDKGRKHAIIQIAVDNPASWINALKYGMQITKVDLDPYDGAKVIYLEKNLTYNNSHHTAYKQESTYSMFLGNDIHHKIPALFNKMQYLIKQGYHGISLNKQTQSLIWQKADYQAQRAHAFKLLSTHLGAER